MRHQIDKAKLLVTITFTSDATTVHTVVVQQRLAEGFTAAAVVATKKTAFRNGGAMQGRDLVEFEHRATAGAAVANIK